MQEVKFGTDGIRDIVNKGLTAQVAYKSGCALALYLKAKIDKPLVYIGVDTRKSAYMLLTAFCSGLMSYGVDVVYLGVLSTPAVSYITAKNGADAGVMITASHNTHEYNGIKIFNSLGEKIGMQTTDIVEHYALNLSKYELSSCDDVGIMSINKKALNSYIRFLRRKIKPFDKKVVFDCANGATSKIISKLFDNKATLIGNSMVSHKVNKESGVMDMKKLQTKVVSGKFDVGFAFDGDGDRIYAVDENGKILDGDSILAIIALYYKQNKRLKSNTIVGTVMTNYGIEATLKSKGIHLIRQHVGDRFVQSEMREHGFILGGEQSGHIILGRYSNTGDGVLAAIELLNIMTATGKSLASLSSELKSYPAQLLSVEVDSETKAYVLNSFTLQEFIGELEQELGYKGRILVRASGTESLIRILVEGEDKSLIKAIAESIKFKIKEIALQRLIY